jgi:hypothetical protein
MSAADFYRPVESEILQGDIFRSVPHLFLTPPIQAIRGPIALPKGRTGYGLYPATWAPSSQLNPAEQPKIGGAFHFTEGEQVSVTCHVTRAMILNHECDIENDLDHRLVALIRPLAPVVNPEHRLFIQQNRNSAYFYLPPGGGDLEEAYVDFRRITALSPAFLDPRDRLAALSPDALRALQAQLFRHFTHRLLLPPPRSFWQKIVDTFHWR